MERILERVCAMFPESVPGECHGSGCIRGCDAVAALNYVALTAATLAFVHTIELYQRRNDFILINSINECLQHVQRK